MQEQIQAIKRKVADCIALAERQLGIKMPQVDIRFDLRGRAAGMAGRRGNSYYLRFNTDQIRLGGKTWDHMINDTVPHEVAHTVCQAFPQYGRNHNNGWKRICRMLGGTGQRCYTEQDAPEAVAAQRPVVYISTAGHEIRVTKAIHTKIQQGRSYTVRGGLGSINRECAYQLSTTPTVTAPVSQPKAPNTARGTKADQLRDYLKQAKADRGSQAFEETVRWAIQTLGMTASLARTYVKNNWSRV